MPDREWTKIGDRYWRAHNDYHATATVIEPYFGADGEYTVRINYYAGTCPTLEAAKAMAEEILSAKT